MLFLLLSKRILVYIHFLSNLHAIQRCLLKKKKRLSLSTNNLSLFSPCMNSFDKPFSISFTNSNFFRLFQLNRIAFFSHSSIYVPLRLHCIFNVLEKKNENSVTPSYWSNSLFLTVLYHHHHCYLPLY